MLEPTGGYERGVVEGLWAVGMPVAQVNAKHQAVRTRLRSLVEDGQDRCIRPCRLCQTHGYQGSGPSSPAHAMLIDLVSRYRQLSHMIAQEKNRHEKLVNQDNARTGAWIEQTLAFLQQQRQAVVDAMAACLDLPPRISSRSKKRGLKPSTCAGSTGFLRQHFTTGKPNTVGWKSLRQNV
ncbi:transposase [Rhizobium sp. SORGH_AS 787]|nr:transposase [Rhizobium sp. SORGH_AS_0787]